MMWTTSMLGSDQAARKTQRPIRPKPLMATRTGMYYLRSRAAADAVKFTVDPNSVKAKNASKKEVVGDKENQPANGEGAKKSVDPDAEEEALMAAKIACSLANKDECVMCGA